MATFADENSPMVIAATRRAQIESFRPGPNAVLHDPPDADGLCVHVEWSESERRFIVPGAEMPPRRKPHPDAVWDAFANDWDWPGKRARLAIGSSSNIA